MERLTKTNVLEKLNSIIESKKADMKYSYDYCLKNGHDFSMLVDMLETDYNEARGALSLAYYMEAITIKQLDKYSDELLNVQWKYQHKWLGI